MSTYIVKMAKASAPAIDRAARRMFDAGYHVAFGRMTVSYQNSQLIVMFDNPSDMAVGGPVLAEEFRADGWGWTVIFDNNDARTGKQIGMRVTHPMFLTQTGDEVRERPDTWSVTGPMPGRNVYLDAETIEHIAQEAAEVVRDMLRTQSLREYGKLPEGTYDLPPAADNPLETVFHRDVAEHNDEPVDAPKPKTLGEALNTGRDTDG